MMNPHRTSVPSDPLEEAVEEMLDLAEDALDQGDPHQALVMCTEVLQGAPEHPGALFVMADAHRDLGALEDAELAYRRVTLVVPDHAAGWSGLASVLFDQLRFGEAHRACLRALRTDPTNSEANHVRGLLRERRGDFRGAARDFLRASRIDPTSFPLPVPLSDETIEDVVAEAAAGLHPAIRSYLPQVPILLEEVPSEHVCLQFDPPAPPSEILGVFHGTSLAERSFDDPWSHLPATIVLFRRNLQRLGGDHERLVQELRISVLEEVGRFIGVEDEDVDGTEPT